MRVLAGGEWRDGFLDAYRAPGEFRVQVEAWRILERLTDVYIVRPRNPMMIWNYLWEVGPREVVRKIASRSGERFRNEKYVSFGIGAVLESSDPERFVVGERVCFLAPLHPACTERVVLPSELLSSFTAETGKEESSILLLAAGTGGDRWWADLAGWSSDSGHSFNGIALPDIMARMRSEAESTHWDAARRLPVDPPSAIRERRGDARGSRNRARATLVGYGNYAKTFIAPNVRRFLDITTAHEIDPLQIPASGGGIRCWDTAPGPRPTDLYDVLLIAGYHHSHGPLAREALARGAYAVVEKPVVVNAAQRTELTEAVGRFGERLFSCFHKRYLPFNRMAFEDLGTTPGQAIHFHCIVYEIPLPRLHWYNWPNSGSRIISNGCHWIDHFLFLNDWSEVVRSELSVAADGTLNATLELANGAVFTMTLTEHGSERIGVQDHVELRANARTVRIVNGGSYVAESSDRFLRKRRINKTRSYIEMYRAIGRAVAERKPGDSLRSLQVSTGAILEMEALYRSKAPQVGVAIPRGPSTTGH